MNELQNNVFEKKNIFYILKCLSVVVIVGIVTEILKFILSIDEPTSSKVEESFFKNIFLGSIGIVLIAPILEEIVFRLPLKKNNHYLSSITLCVFLFLSASLFFLRIMCLLYIGAILLYQFDKKLVMPDCLTKNIIIVLSIVTFVSLHFANYQEEQLNSLPVFSKIFLFLPQLVVGLILTAVRLKTFFLNAVIIHSLYNLIILTLALFFN
ncbi:CPBP family glutamic-type intramembrane protease [Flavobacterium sp. MMS24-S5]|uniref:CPBP family glutamic-type intramembrane protease n=1 Tax=Flavobacterium sp. MMS24-S5 TaxID=3416605 RepID=UPI003CFE15B5